MVYQDELQEIEFIARSENRVQILEELRRAGTLSKSELRGASEVARTTLVRNADALVERGWVENSNNQYSITPCGELLIEELTDLLETVREAKRLRPFFEWMPPAAFGLSVEVLSDADVTVSTSQNPYAPVNRHVESLASAERARCLLPAVDPQGMRTVERRVTSRDGDGDHELIITEDVAETLRTDPALDETVDALLSTDRIAIRVSPRDVPYYAGILDGVVQIGVSDRKGVPQALLETDADEAREWATTLYRDYRSQSTAFDS